MIDPHSFRLFIIAALALLLIPGPAVLYIMTRSIDQGRMAGLVSVFGIELGNLILAVLSVAGLSAIIASSAVAFSIVKYLGAAYLIYLGIKRIFSKDVHTQTEVPRKRLSHIFFQGTFVAVLNPKTALFFLSFLPQFINVSQGNIWQQTLILGLTFVGLGTITDSAYALLAGTIGNNLKQRSPIQWGQRFVSGGIYLTLGVISAFSGSSKN